MKASKMRDMSKDDLILEESELRKQLLKIRFQAATGQLDSAPKLNHDGKNPGQKKKS